MAKGKYEKKRQNREQQGEGGNGSDGTVNPIPREKSKQPKPAPPPVIKAVRIKEPPPPPPKDSWFKRYLWNPISAVGLAVVWVLGAVALIPALNEFRPRISIQQGELLDPHDPFSTQFTVRNDNQNFTDRDVHSTCSSRYVVTATGFVQAGMPTGRREQTIPVLKPLHPATVDCPPFVGGLRDVTVAYITMNFEYKQDWWLWEQQEVFPLKGMKNSQNEVHWFPITEEQLLAEGEKFGYHSH